PLSTDWLLSIGGLGAMASTTPLDALLSWFTWREAFLVLALLTFCVVVVIHFCVPKAYESKYSGNSDLFAAVCILYS
ncbi:MFS transporter, partial [Pseudomonas syringae pv. tagetis]